jgi:hypothetical protein
MRKIYSDDYLELQPSPEPDFEERLDNNQLATCIPNAR